MKTEKRSSLKWILKAIKPVYKGILALTIIQTVLSISMVSQAVLMRNVIDNAVEEDSSRFIHAAVLLTAIIALQIVLKAFTSRFDEYVRAETENTLKERTYRTILHASYADISMMHTGELQNRMTNDTVVIADAVATVFPDTVALIVRMSGAVCILFMLDSRFALIFLAGGLFIMLTASVFRARSKALHKVVQESDGKVRSFLQETISDLLVIKSFGVEQRSAESAAYLMESHKTERMKKNWFSIICNMGFSIIMRGGYIFGLIWCGFRIIAGTISYGTLAAVLQLVGQVQAPAASMTGYIPKYFGMIASAERLIELEKLTQDKERIKSKDSNKDFCNITLNDVSFSYSSDEKDEILDHVSIMINKGDFVALTGESGAGKSTLLKLMLAVYEPSSGKVQIACNDGKMLDAGACSGSMMAYVPQGLLLLSGNIYQAVSFLTDDIDKERVRISCHIACADFVNDLPDGLDTVLGEHGEGLSEGQKQRIAIARAIYRDSPVILLDEATSALDEKTEFELLTRLKDLTDKTVVIVTHRKAALRFCDHVYEIKDKRAVEI